MSVDFQLGPRVIRIVEIKPSSPSTLAAIVWDNLSIDPPIEFVVADNAAFADAFKVGDAYTVKILFEKVSK